MFRSQFSDDMDRNSPEFQRARRNLEIFSKLPNLFPGMMAFWNKDLRCEFANKYYQEWFGRTEEELEGIYMADVNPVIFKQIYHHVEGALAGRPQHFLLDLPKQDGSKGYVLAQYVPLGEPGSVEGFFTLVSDISKERELLGRMSLFESAFDSVMQGVAITDLNRSVIYCNAAYKSITGYGIEEMRGCDPASLLVGEKSDPVAEKAVLAGLRSFEGFAGVVVNHRKNGEPFDNKLAISVSRDERGNPTHFIDVIQDVSEELAAKRNLAQVNRELVLALAELMDKKMELAGQAREAALGAMGASIAHELATPLGSARLASDALDSHVEEFKKQIERGIKRRELEKFVEACSQASKILGANLGRAAEIVGVFKKVAVSGADPTRRKFNVRELVENAALSLRPLMAKASLELDFEGVDGNLEGFGNPGPLGQVFVNLIQNSALHGFPSGKPGRLTFEARLIAEGMAEIVYADDGAGLSEAALSQVFDPFFTTKRGAGGSGIGMHLAKKDLDEFYGAKIAASNGSNGGAMFKITLPLAAT